MFSFALCLLASSLVARAVGETADVEEKLLALHERLAASNAKMEALRASASAAASAAAAAAPSKRNVDGAKHTSVLGRKRAAASLAELETTTCADGSTLDTDRDGHLDCFDLCPTDFRKTRPGVCGCGVADIDSDLDGRADCIDRCPLDAAKTDVGLCGCGAADTGCGCNVQPVRAGDCAHVVGVGAGAALADGATYDVFAPDGGIGARVVLPRGALAPLDGEQLVLKLESAAARNSVEQPHSAVLDIALVGAARDRAQNGFLLERAATVCLAPESELAVRGLCLGFFDVKTNALKCFDSELVYADGLACARVPLLARVQLVRQSRQTVLAPFVKSVAPALCPANGRCELVVSGGNFDRGVLTRVAIGDQAIDVDSCSYSATELRCGAIPAGRGVDLPLHLSFTNHVAQDMSFDVHFANAISYEQPRIFEVSIASGRVQVKGENFGPVGALADGAIRFDGVPCADARVDVHDAQLSCAAPSHTLAKRRVFYDSDGETSVSSSSSSSSSSSVSVHMGGDAVHSSAAHFVESCSNAEDTMCADRTCVPRGAFCPTCPSGWSQCPLAMPVQAHGRCRSFSWQVTHKADVFDLTLDGALMRVPIGADAYFGVAARDSAKACMSFAMPTHEAGFASHVYNITVTTGIARGHIELRPIVALDDVFGYCVARYNAVATPPRWECQDESLEFGEQPDNLVQGNVALSPGANLFALIKDNCPHAENPLQTDADGDGVGDACDAPAEVVGSCRDRSMGNVKYIRQILETVSFDVEEQPCPFESDKHVAVCNPSGKIFSKHMASWAGPAVPLPLKAPFEASTKGSRKTFPVRAGINSSPAAQRTALGQKQN